MNHTPIALALAALIAATPIDAARLCRDSKGLFTPCIGAPSARTHNVRPGSDAAPAESADAARAATRKPQRRAKPPLVGRAKLCRDTKGAFTPCPH